MSLYLLLAISLGTVAAGLYAVAKRVGIPPVQSSVFAGTAIVAFLLGWAFHGGGASEASPTVAAVATPVVAGTPVPPAALFHEALSDAQFPNRVAAGTTVNGSVVVQNTSTLTWRAHNGPISLGFHLLDTDGHAVAEGRALLGADVKPGEKRRVRFSAKMPAAPGRYTLTLDVVYEYYSWFESVRNQPARIDVTVT